MTVRHLIQELINHDMDRRVAINAKTRTYPLDEHILISETAGLTNSYPVVILTPELPLIERSRHDCVNQLTIENYQTIIKTLIGALKLVLKDLDDVTNVYPSFSNKCQHSIQVSKQLIEDIEEDDKTTDMYGDYL